MLLLCLQKVKASQSDGSPVFLNWMETWDKWDRKNGITYVPSCSAHAGIPSAKQKENQFSCNETKTQELAGSRSRFLKSQVCSCNKRLCSPGLPEPPPNEAIATVTNGSCQGDGNARLDRVIEVNPRGRCGVFRAKFSLTWPTVFPPSNQSICSLSAPPHTHISHFEAFCPPAPASSAAGCKQDTCIPPLTSSGPRGTASRWLQLLKILRAAFSKWHRSHLACVSGSRREQKLCKYFTAWVKRMASCFSWSITTLRSSYPATIKCVTTVTAVRRNTGSMHTVKC